jgi:hypothetical protein
VKLQRQETERKNREKELKKETTAKVERTEEKETKKKEGEIKKEIYRLPTNRGIHL